MRKVLLSITFIVPALTALIGVMTPYAYSQSFSLTTAGFSSTSVDLTNSSARSMIPMTSRSMISGTVYGCDMFGQLQPIAWASVSANNWQTPFVAYSGGGGNYEMHVPAGSYDVTVVEPGYVSVSELVTVSEGTDVVINFSLAETIGTCLGGASVASATTTTFTTYPASPVPEYPNSLALTLLAVLITLGVLTHRRYARRKSPLGPECRSP